MKASLLKVQKGNPRTITDEAMEKLQESIERDPQFMALRPLVVDEDNVVIGGNQRLKAIKKLGYKEIPDEWVVRAEDLTEEQNSSQNKMEQNSTEDPSGVP